MTVLDQDRAARLVDIARWRTVYHHTTSDGASGRAETIAWFETTAEAAWAEAATQLPPPGYHRPDSVTIERGTFTPLPEGGHGWQTLGPTLDARVDNNGLVLDEGDRQDTELTPQPDTALASAGQQQLF